MRAFQQILAHLAGHVLDQHIGSPGVARRGSAHSVWPITWVMLLSSAVATVHPRSPNSHDAISTTSSLGPRQLSLIAFRPAYRIMLAYNPLVKFVASLDAIPNVDQPFPRKPSDLVSLSSSVRHPILATRHRDKPADLETGEIRAGSVPPSFNIALRGSPAEQLTWSCSSRSVLEAPRPSASSPRR